MTGLKSIVDLKERQLKEVEPPATGTTIVFQVRRSIEDFDYLVQQARGVEQLEVKLNEITILPLDPCESLWFTLDAARHSG